MIRSIKLIINLALLFAGLAGLSMLADSAQGHIEQAETAVYEITHP